jgi:uncharacterized protein DUF6228
MDQFELQSIDGESRLVLLALDANSYRADITAFGLSVSHRIYGLFGCDELDVFFAGLAQYWSGWEGPRKWSGREGGFHIQAVHDRLGHVTVTVRVEGLSRVVPYTWSAEVNLVVEAGQLARVADNASRFARSFATAA